MNAGTRVLLTGGTGLLGQELAPLLGDVVAPPRAALDVLLPETIAAAIRRERPKVLVHAAAYTDVAGAESERALAWATNVDGTRNVALACRDADVLLVHVSTDYVFDGQRGGYREDDTPGPPINHYALTKIAAEAVARCAPRHLVLRTSFRPRKWPYARAYTDVVTSQDYVDVIAPMLAAVVRRASELDFDTLHVGTEPKTVHALARRRQPAVGRASRSEAAVRLPADISLDTRRYAERFGPG
ncbi:MAG: SDR family oxidoreductase [Longimicrobiales bacterium]